MLDALRGYYVFAHVAELRSFSRAAERLGLTRSAISKHVVQLESLLGVQLIVRTTRKLALTDAGERVYESCARMAAEVAAANEAAQGHGSLIAGKLRVTAPAALGSQYLVPLVGEFMQLHPALEIDLIFDDAYVDLLDERIDIALRVGGRHEQSFVSRRLATVELWIVAGPAYLARVGAPRTAEDLTKHEWLVHAPGAQAARTNKLNLRKGKRVVSVATRGRLSCNSGPSNLSAALAGLGLLLVPDFEVAHELRAGRLVRVLPSWQLEQRSLELVFPPRRHVLGRVRALTDFLATRFQTPPWR
jgi:DNA-binding transcriptional LysR family regulator